MLVYASNVRPYGALFLAQLPLDKQYNTTAKHSPGNSLTLAEGETDTGSVVLETPDLCFLLAVTTLAILLVLTLVGTSIYPILTL